MSQQQNKTGNQKPTLEQEIDEQCCVSDELEQGSKEDEEDDAFDSSQNSGSQQSCDDNEDDQFSEKQNQQNDFDNLFLEQNQFMQDEIDRQKFLKQNLKSHKQPNWEEGKDSEIVKDKDAQKENNVLNQEDEQRIENIIKEQKFKEAKELITMNKVLRQLKLKMPEEYKNFIKGKIKDDKQDQNKKRKQFAEGVNQTLYCSKKTKTSIQLIGDKHFEKLQKQLTQTGESQQLSEQISSRKRSNINDAMDLEDEDQENSEDNEYLEDLLESFKYQSKQKVQNSRDKNKQQQQKDKKIQNNKISTANEKGGQEIIKDNNKSEILQSHSQEYIDNDKCSQPLIDINTFAYSVQNNSKKSIGANTKEMHQQQQQYESIRQNTLKEIEERSDYYDQREIKYWIEIYDSQTKKWISLDPVVHEIFFQQKEKIIQKTYGMPILYIVSCNKLQIESEELASLIERKRFLNDIFFTDQTSRYSEKWLKVLYNRRKIQLDQWWINVFRLFQSHIPEHLLNQQFREMVQQETEELQDINRNCLPQTNAEFRMNPFYCLKSQLKRYQGLHPDAVPTKMKFKDEDIYERKDITQLNSRIGWSRLKRQLKPNQQPIKQINSTLIPGKLIDLYGLWQTDPLVYEANTLPKNEYGNFELFSGILPEGTQYLEKPYIAKICKKFEIDFVDAVSGFEGGKHNKTHVVKSGVLVLSKDVDKINELYEKEIQQILQQQKDSEEKRLISIWKQLFKAILMKKEINEIYSKINN